MSYKKLFALLIAPVFVVGLTACDVEQTEEGQMPEIEVEEEGELPAYDVDPADVEVGEDTVTVPDVDIEQPAADTGMAEGGMEESGMEEGGR